LNGGLWYHDLSDIEEVTGTGRTIDTQVKVSDGIRLRRTDRSTMQLTFTLSQSTPVTVHVYTMTDKVVQILVDRVLSAGLQSVERNTTHVSAGTYIIRMAAFFATNVKTVSLF
jgi:hypothetical protein